METHYLPSIRYLQLFFAYADVLLERHEHYQKGSYRNRCHILTAQGPGRLSVPLEKGKHQQLPIAEVRIAYHSPWHKQHWHAIQTAYGKAPFFMHYGDEMRDILFRRYDMLYALNLAIIQWILKIVQAPAQLRETDQFMLNAQEGIDDFRGKILPEVNYNTPPYSQVFLDRLGFVPNLSALDLIMHLGPSSYTYLKESSVA